MLLYPEQVECYRFDGGADFRTPFSGHNFVRVSFHRENYDQLSNFQFKFLLHFASSNTKAVLEPIIERIEDREYLDDRTKYLLQHINLKLCMDKDVKLYNQISVRFSKKTEI